VTLIYLRGDEQLIAERLNWRHYRYMPASLLHSQFEILEEPSEDEHAVVVPVSGSLSSTVIDLLHKVAAAQAQ
jgi:gluconokinase